MQGFQNRIVQLFQVSVTILKPYINIGTKFTNRIGRTSVVSVNQPSKSNVLITYNAYFS